MSSIQRIWPAPEVGSEVSNSHLLPDVADLFLKRLEVNTRVQLKERTQQMGVLRVGTLCSGSDAPIPVVMHLARKLGLRVEHIFSCEFSKRKREWIQQNFAGSGLKHLFGDVKEVGQAEEAYDHLSAQKVSVPSVDLIIAGFVCKSVSMENNDREKYARCIDCASGQTGETFSGCAAYIARHQPGLVICENVEGLAKRIRGSEPQVLSVMNTFQNLGYSAGWGVLDSRHFQLPQRRRRCWMWASRRGSEESVRKAVPRTLARLASGKHLLLASLLTSEEGEATQLGARESKVVETALQRLSMKDQEGGDVIIDVAKSDYRAPICVGATSCIVPNSKPYHLKSKRILSPEEVLKVQGIYAQDFPALRKILQEKGGSALARDLAGNAFTATVCMAVVLSVLAHCELTPQDLVASRSAKKRSASAAAMTQVGLLEQQQQMPPASGEGSSTSSMSIGGSMQEHKPPQEAAEASSSWQARKCMRWTDLSSRSNLAIQELACQSVMQQKEASTKPDGCGGTSANKKLMMADPSAVRGEDKENFHTSQTRHAHLEDAERLDGQTHHYGISKLHSVALGTTRRFRRLRPCKDDDDCTVDPLA